MGEKDWKCRSVNPNAAGMVIISPGRRTPRFAARRRGELREANRVAAAAKSSAGLPVQGSIVRNTQSWPFFSQHRWAIEDVGLSRNLKFT